MMSSNQLQKMLNALPQQPETVDRVLAYAEEFPGRFSAHHVKLLAEFALQYCAQQQADAGVVARLLAALSALAERQETLQISETSRLDVKDPRVLAVLRALAPALQAAFSAEQLWWLAENGVFELVDASSFEALPNVPEFAQRLPLLERLRNYCKIPDDALRFQALAEAFSVPFGAFVATEAESESNVNAKATLEALADAVGQEKQPAVIQQLDAPAIFAFIEAAWPREPALTLGLVVNLMGQLEGARGRLAELVLPAFNAELPPETLAMYALVFAMQGMQAQLLELLRVASKRGTGCSELYVNILQNLRQFAAEEQLEEFSRICLRLSRMDEIDRRVSYEIASALMDGLAEPNGVLQAIYEEVLFCFESYQELYCAEERPSPEDEELLENMQSWVQYVEQWLVR